MKGLKKKGEIDIQPACITYDKHFRKSIYHLDKILSFMSSNYSTKFKKRNISCIDLKGMTFDNFIIT